MQHKNSYTRYKNRSIIKLFGSDKRKFLQNILSNNSLNVSEDTCVYAFLLSPQGRFLHDMFLSLDKCGDEECVVIECEGGERATDLYMRLKRYILRADVKISDPEALDVILTNEPSIGLIDPRTEELWNRSYSADMTVSNCEEVDFSVWDKLRISCCVPDGSRDMSIDKSNLIESNIDKLNGIDWNKGCYIGQELTARMYHRELAKKHIRAIKFHKLPLERGEKIIIGDVLVGEMLSSCDNLGLALIKDQHLSLLPEIGELIK